MVSRLAPAATGGKAAHTPDGVSHGQSGGEGIASGECRQLMFAHVPGGTNQRRNQPTGEHPARSQGAQAENLAGVIYICVPVINDVKNLSADDPRQHHENPKIPSFFGIDPVLLGIAHTDPQPHQHSRRYQEPVCWESELADVKKLGKHYLIRCKASDFDEPSLAGRNGCETSSRKGKPTH